MSNALARLARFRMAESGEKYTAARRVLLSDPAEYVRVRKAERSARERSRYPFTPRDGLDRRHVLSAWETSRRHH